ncbi:MAG: sodium:solute symporter [Deltaproteobacteria bacterium]|nr:sodium:solute symporter [Deltaproteobacteria bacterium]
MTAVDWIVLVGTTLAIVVLGIVRHRASRTMAGYLKGDGALRWPTIGLSVMATQASAITFLSTPGQAYEDGMRFVQFYFGLPLAMVIVAAVFVPIYYRMKVYTAYEYLESRFDVRVRLFAALLFLVSRGLAAGITIYAPAILLSAILGWPLEATSIGIGVVVVVYTVIGGSKAVSQTQRAQMVIILVGMVAAGFVACGAFPDGVSVGDAVAVAGALDRINPVDASFALEDRYNLWSGIAGGVFLSLAYFGTDQSQVGRYLGGKSVTESRLGLLFNGMLKIPMQAGILFIGVLVFVVYVFSPPPALWNEPTLEAARRRAPAELARVEAAWNDAAAARESAARAFIATRGGMDDERARAELVTAQERLDQTRKEVKATIARVLPGAELQDSDYIFLGFAKSHLPAGLLGLLVAVILAAAMSSIASELQALGTTTTLDFHRRLARAPPSDAATVKLSMGYTLLWGGAAIAFAIFASMLDNLIQAVNILGSLFYGTSLGIFLVAFFLKGVRGTAVLIAAVVAEAAVVTTYLASDIGFLWFNLIGCAIVFGLAPLLELTLGRRARAA